MDLIYRIHNYKTFDAFKLKKIMEYQSKPKDELIKMISDRKEESKMVWNALDFIGSKQRVEDLVTMDSWKNIKIGFVKEALKNKCTTK